MSQLFIDGGPSAVAEAIQESRSLPDLEAKARLGAIAEASHGALTMWADNFPGSVAHNLAAEALGYISERPGGDDYISLEIAPTIKRLDSSNLLRVCRMNLAGELNTSWWHDNAQNLAPALNFGAGGNTTNPLLVWEAIKTNPLKWVPVLLALWEKYPHYTPEQICLEMTLLVIAEHAALLEPIYRATNGSSGAVSVQLAPDCAFNDEAMFAQSVTVCERLSEMGIGNAIFKLPGTWAGLQVLPAVAEATKMGLNITVNYTYAQQSEFAKAIEMAKLDVMSYLTQMNGRLAEPIIMELGADPETIQRWCMHAVRQSAYEKLYNELGYTRTRPLGAACRGPWDLDGMFQTGRVATRVTMFPERQTEYDEHQRQIDPEGFWQPVPEDIMELLLTSKTFRQAYEPDGLTPKQFDEFPATVATLTQFGQNYAAFVAWCADRKPA